MTRGNEFLHDDVDMMRAGVPSSRVTFERDEGQEYGVGARVNVHPMNTVYRTLQLSPSDGQYSVTRCERIRDTGWQGLRVSLQLVDQTSVSVPGSTTGADARS
jgi:hypothetical protein